MALGLAWGGLWLIAVAVAIRDIVRWDFKGHSRGSASLILILIWSAAGAGLTKLTDFHPDSFQQVNERFHFPIGSLCSLASILGMMRDDTRGRALLAGIVAIPVTVLFTLALMIAPLPD